MTPRASLFTRDPRTARRRAAEARFRGFGLAAVLIGMAALAMLLTSVLSSGLGAFRQTHIHIPVALEASALDPGGTGDPSEMRRVTTLTYGKVIEAALMDAIAKAGIAIDGLTEAEITAMLSKEAPAQLRARVLAEPDLVGGGIDASLLANGRIDGYLKGRVTMDSAQLDRNVTPQQLLLADAMLAKGMMSKDFNFAFLTAGDASDLRPEAAGLGVAIIGSAYMMLIVLGLALPLGVATSIWLEEFAPKNRWTDLIEVNIANLAAVPSIVFGVLGLAIFINFAGLPQSAPIVGGLVLVLMTLPTVIIATRASLKAVPQSIRDAALGVGASRMQTVFHHVLPLAAPGILTGAILGLAQALGETAPLLLIGMVAFVREFPSAPPEGFFDPASALPAQIYNWTQRSDPAFVERASGAIIVLLVFLLVMNAAAILLRRRFERRW